MATDRAPTGEGRRREVAPIEFPTLGRLVADSSVAEKRSALIRDLEAAGFPLRHIASVFNTTIAVIREDRAVPFRLSREAPHGN